MRFLYIFVMLFLTFQLGHAESVEWDCGMLKKIIEDDAAFSAIDNWRKKMEHVELKDLDFKRASGGPGLYVLVDEKDFDWNALGIEPFSPEVRILGRNPNTPDGYFVKLHRMFGIVIVLTDEAMIWIDREFVCLERGKLIGYNMPESAMGGAPR